MNIANRLLEFFRAEISAECEASFPNLRVIPDTYVRKHLYFFRSLAPEDVSSFIECLATRACRCHSFILDIPASEFAPHPMEERVRAAVGSYWEDEFTGIPLLRVTVSQYKIDHAKGKESCVSDETFAYASSIRSAKAPDIRRAVKAAFAEELSCQEVEKIGGGDYIHRCNVDGTEAAVWVDYGGRSAQLRYCVELPEFGETAIPIRGRLCFEKAMSFGNGDWNFITEENLDASAKVLPRLVKYCCALPRRIRTYFQ